MARARKKSPAVRRRRRRNQVAMPARAAADHAAIAGLLHKALDGITSIDNRVTRTETQNEHIIDEQQNASRGRGVLHEKLDEVSGDLVAVRYEIGALDKRVNLIDAGFKVLETARVERQVIRGFLGTAFRKGWAAAAAGSGIAIWIWHQFDGPRDAILRWLGKA